MCFGTFLLLLCLHGRLAPPDFCSLLVSCHSLFFCFHVEGGCIASCSSWRLSRFLIYTSSKTCLHFLEMLAFVIFCCRSMSRRIATLKRLAGLQGNDKARADACFRLAAAYGMEDGVKKDGKEEVKWLIKASELGHARAQCILGLCHKNGEGVTQSYEKAFHWFQKDADQGECISATHPWSLLQQWHGSCTER